MEARRRAMCKCCSDLGLGVKSQSRLVIAGSYQSRRKSSLERDSSTCRATDWGFRQGNLSVPCPTPNGLSVVDLGRRGACVRCVSERGTTLTTVKVPK